MTSELNAAVVAELARDREWEKTTHCGGYLVSDLRAAFEAVEDRTNWKWPIEVDVEGAAAMMLTVTAIEYFHGSTVAVTHRGGLQFRLKSPGYAG